MVESEEREAAKVSRTASLRVEIVADIGNLFILS